MDARLQIGGTAAPGWEYRSVDDVARNMPSAPTYDRIWLAPAADTLGDLWPLFRACRNALTEHGILSLSSHTGSPLREADVRNLLRLNGLRLYDVSTTGATVQMHAVAEGVESNALSCTVVIPCRNEVDNIADLVRRTPEMGAHTEILFVDGASTDGTPDRIQVEIDAHPERDMALLHQRGGGGKAEAVFLGFDHAKGDIVMILDADMTVAPEDLPRFYLALAEGRTDFANGTRFLYPMETGAMRPVNNVGNRVFCAYLSWLLHARITDTLCGTKAMRRSAWHCIRKARPEFGGHDPWGDFDLLLGAAACGLDVADVPIVYGARIAGESKMHAFSHGRELARTCISGFVALKLRRGPGGHRV